MKPRPRLPFFIGSAALALALAFGAREAVACTCMEIPPETAFRNADAVFAGVAVGSRTRGSPRDQRSLFREYRIRMTHRWKGSEKGVVRVRSGLGGGMCGVEFAKGERYLVYARRRDGHLWTGLCTRTGLLRNAIWDRTVLEEPKRLGSSGSMPVPGVDALLDSLSSADGRVVYEAARVLANDETHRAPILRAFAAALRDTHLVNPESMILGIGQAPAVIDSLADDLLWLLHHGTGQARGSALGYLHGVLPPRAWLNELDDALHAKDLGLLRAAVSSADRTNGGPPELRERLGSRLLELLTHDDEWVRRESTRVLISAYPERDSAHLEILERMIATDPDPGIRYSAGFSLEEIRKRHPRP